MTLDPNWFYSSLAQSAAAIVGIVGSVLVVRLQAQLETAKRNKEHILPLFLASRSRWIAHFISMKGLVAYIERMRPIVMQALDSGATELKVGEKVTFTANACQSPPWSIQISPVTLETYERDKTAAILLGDALGSLSRIKELHKLGSNRSTFEGIRLSVPDEAYGIVDSVLADLTRIAEPIARHSIQTSVHISIILTVVLAWVCIFGLLVPLTYLSAYEDIHKYLLISAFAAGVFALPVVLAFQIMEVKTVSQLAVPPEDSL